MEIDVFREAEEYAEEDIDLAEFDDEIEEWVIEELRKVGLDTAKSVLAVTKDELLRRTELEEETIEEVLNILKQEFES
jgi:N utilization substance protein A